MYVQSDRVQVKVIDQAGTIVINRPDHANALTRQMIAELGEALDDLYFDGQVRTIVLTSAGDAFSVGLDLAESQATATFPNHEERWGEEAADLRDLLIRMLEVTKPIIAAVNGEARSFGASLALAADIVVAADNAEFGFPDARQGLVAGLAAPLLCRQVGAGNASRLLFTGRTVDAAEAARLGIFHELIAVDKVWARAMQLAAECALCAPPRDSAYQAYAQRNHGRTTDDATRRGGGHAGYRPDHRRRGRGHRRRPGRARAEVGLKAKFPLAVGGRRGS